MNRKWLCSGLAAGLALGGLMLGALALNPVRGTAQATPAEGAPKPMVVEAVSPHRRDLVRQERYPGTVLPWEETQLYAKASGYLQEIRVDKGDFVKRGQLLAVLNIPEMADELSQQRALENAAREHSREPIVALETARAEVERCQSELDGARADLAAARAAAAEPESLLAAGRAEAAAARAAVQAPTEDVGTAQANLRAAQADLQAAQADLERYQADYELQDRTHQRYTRLLDHQVVTQQEFDQVEAAYHAARAALNTAKMRIGAMEERMAAAQSAVRAAQAKVAAAQAQAVSPEAQIRNIEARARTARARVASAEQAVCTAAARVRVARAQRQEAVAKIASAESDVKTAAAAELKARTLMQYSRLTAPYDGVITARNVDTGQLIQASTASQNKPLLVLSSIDRLRVMLPLAESDVPNLKVGNAVTLTVHELPGRSWTGKIARYTNDLDPVAHTMNAEIDLPNSGRVLRPGMYADVVVILEPHPNALVVPSSAVVAETQKRSLWVVRVGKAKKVEVTVGVDNAVDAEITSGIDDNDRIITSGQTSLQPDQAVKPVQSKQ